MAYFTGRKWHGWSKGWNFLIFHILQSMGGDFLHLTNTGSFYKIPGFSSSHLSLFFFFLNSLVSSYMLCSDIFNSSVAYYFESSSEFCHQLSHFLSFWILCSFQVVRIRNCWIACYSLRYRRELPAFLWTALMLLI